MVWARSFGSPPVTAECAAPFLEVGGLLVVSEPLRPPVSGPSSSQVPAADRWPADGLAPLGQEPLVTSALEVRVPSPPTGHAPARDASPTGGSGRQAPSIPGVRDRRKQHRGTFGLAFPSPAARKRSCST